MRRGRDLRRRRDYEEGHVSHGSSREHGSNRRVDRRDLPPRPTSNYGLSSSSSSGAPRADAPIDIRRLSSLAGLFRGEDVCGAVCFYEGELLISTNNTRESEFIRDMLNYLSNVARQAQTFYKGIFEARDINDYLEEKSEAIEQETDSFLGKYSSLSRSEHRSYYMDLVRYIKKATNSIIKCYLPIKEDEIKHKEGAFSKQLVNIFRNKRYQFIAGGERVHAELKILEYILRQHNNLEGRIDTLHIGVSKQCCDNCYKLIDSVNEVILERYGYRLVDVRSSHGGAFRAGTPEFMIRGNTVIDERIRQEIEARFLSKIHLARGEERTIEIAFARNPDLTVTGSKQLHRRSPSPEPKIYGSPETFSLERTVEKYHERRNESEVLTKEVEKKRESREGWVEERKVDDEAVGKEGVVTTGKRIREEPKVVDFKGKGNEPWSKKVRSDVAENDEERSPSRGY